MINKLFFYNRLTWIPLINKILKKLIKIILHKYSNQIPKKKKMYLVSFLMPSLWKFVQSINFLNIIHKFFLLENDNLEQEISYDIIDLIIDSKYKSITFTN